MTEGNWNNTLKVIHSSPANVVNTSTPEDVNTNATEGILYVWSGWGPTSYTPLSSGNYWTYVFFKCSGINYSIFFAMASSTLYKYNFSGGVWTRIDSPDLNTRNSLGYIQDTGTITLSESIANYKFLVIRVGYYQSGYPTYGVVTIPVSSQSISTSDTYATSCIIGVDSTIGEYKFGFDSNTVFHVYKIPNSTWYSNVYGIR